jgi:hypothetical protein
VLDNFQGIVTFTTVLSNRENERKVDYISGWVKQENVNTLLVAEDGA